MARLICSLPPVHGAGDLAEGAVNVHEYGAPSISSFFPLHGLEFVGECWQPLRRRSWGRRWSQEPARSNPLVLPHAYSHLAPMAGVA